jgi:hypothetical protein
MSAHLLSLLQEGIEVRPWLERQLVGSDLLNIVRELTAVHGPETDAGPVWGLLTRRRPEILERGLAALTDEEVQAVFRSPSSLLRLQEWVLTDGGPYWDGVLTGSAAAPYAPLPLPTPPFLARARSFPLWYLVSHIGVAAAAAILVWFLAGNKPVSMPATGSVDLAATTPADAVLPTLAAQIDHRWSELRRQADAASALWEIQQTCAVLAATPLPQLSDPARAAVQHDLDQLRREIERQRRVLERGGDLRKVRAAVEYRVDSLLSARWRDPADLPESDRDPDDLPPSPDAV